MGETSNISWCDSTWNVAVGCKKVDSDCRFCYMYRDSMNGTRYNPREIRRTTSVFDLPLRLKGAKKIFTSSLTDFFLEEIDSYRDELWEIIRKCPQHTFQILTKRPERVAQCLPADWGMGYDNVWLGTSCGSQGALNKRLPHLLKLHAVVKFLSIEPLWQGMTFYDSALYGSAWFKNIDDDGNKEGKLEMDVDWVIIGGESGNDFGKYTYRPCQLDWIESIIEECRENGETAVFVKQLGTHLAKELKLSDRHGGLIEEFPEHLRIREFPMV